MSPKRSRNPFRDAAEERFKYKVDVEVPRTQGLGKNLNDMIDWCKERLDSEEWTQHGYMEKPIGHFRPKDYARFYFEKSETATEFVNAWLIVENWGGKLARQD